MRFLVALFVVSVAAAACAIGDLPPGCRDDDGCLAPRVCRAGACIGFSTDDAGSDGGGGGGGVP